MQWLYENGVEPRMWMCSWVGEPNKVWSDEKYETEENLFHLPYYPLEQVLEELPCRFNNEVVLGLFPAGRYILYSQTIAYIDEDGEPDYDVKAYKRIEECWLGHGDMHLAALRLLKKVMDEKND